MSDYSQSIDFSAKDALATGDANKVAKGVDIDTELALISTAITSKFDSNDLASTAQAEGLSLNTVLITPSTLNDVLVENGGMLGDIQALADPAADQLLGWDDSVNAVVGWVAGTGLGLTATPSIELDHLGFEDLVDPDADRIAYWDDSAGKFDWLIPGLALTITDLTIDLDHLGFEDLVDPDADRIAYWDDSAGKFDWLVPGNGLEINLLNLQITDVAATTTNPMIFSSGAPDIDLEALTTIAGNALSATDTFLVDAGGTPKGIEYQDMGLVTQTAQGSQTVAAGDMNTIMEFNAAATLSIDTNANVPIPRGTAIIIVVDNASAVVTVDALAGVTLNSIFHPGGLANGQDTVNAGGTAVLLKTEPNEWYLSGDIST